MSVAEILSGPIADRPNRAAHQMTEAEARGILSEIERAMPKKRRGVAVRKLVNMNTGHLSDEAINLYIKYAEAYGA